MEERYLRNIPAISQADMDILKTKRVLVLGCGGLGGYVIEFLLRLGIGSITAVDGDVFTPSNLNRQLLCDESNIGTPKVFAAASRAEKVNSQVRFTPVYEYFTEKNAARLLEGADLVIDALDNVPARLLMEDAAEAAGLTIVHGAIGSSDVQAMLIFPGERLLHRLYGDGTQSFEKTVLPMTPAFCAAIQVTAAAEFLCKRSTGLEGALLTASLRPASADIIPLR